MKIKNGGQALSIRGKSKERVDQWDGHASQPMMALTDDNDFAIDRLKVQCSPH